MEPHDLQRTLRRLEPAGWTGAARRFAASLRTAGHAPGRLLVVGTPDHEPWHLTAHLDQTARFRDLSALRPVLVRWRVPEGAPPHLSVGVDVVPQAGRGTTVLVATASAQDDDLLERLSDARRGGAVLLAVAAGGGPLDDLAHDALALPPVEDGLATASHALSSPLLHAPVRRGLFRRRSA